MKDREGRLVRQLLLAKAQPGLAELRRAVLDRFAAGLISKRKAKRLHTLLDDLEYVAQRRLMALLITGPLSLAAQDVARAFDRIRSPERRARVAGVVLAELKEEVAAKVGGPWVRPGSHRGP